MLRSMTAYGRGDVTSEAGRFVVEMSSVNRRHLDVKVSMPRELQRFEIDVRKHVARSTSRGSVSVYITAYYDDKSPRSVVANMPLVRQLRDAWSAINEELGYEKKGVNPKLLLEEQGVLLYDDDIADEESYRSAVLAAVDKALEGFVSMKNAEGSALNDDIVARIETLEKTVSAIESNSTGATEAFREKLLARIEEVVAGTTENEERILREVAIYAEKLDITEEITRLRSSIAQFNGMLSEKKDSVGKTIEFLVQELNREINTISSKASSAEIAKLVVIAKSELEKIREQIQNVE
ncbi:MAG: YicC family protein [Waddliaceae bacterium]|jgi:uncharacterized protein (TIGR00255 family)|nr:YicC family protein [Waddliaceae bacterium]MBT3579221.1 YicC family protein [Waddliaceae bacterium]MBT4444279.1 YicC family protein [Waddliaceae bacterium]MBT6928920.1 YicC family protein [Waddliaceae bacterium]MBT7264167.1 YicC family protein [Waddliaceae bacterium]